MKKTLKKLLFYENSRYRRCCVVENQELQYFQEEFKDELNTQGNVYIGTIVKISQSVNAVFVNYGHKKNGFLNLHSIHPQYFHNIDNEKLLEEIKKKNIQKTYKHIDINKVLRVGDLLMVQVTRENSYLEKNKGNMLSTFISLKSKYFKYIPNSCSSQIFLPDPLKSMVTQGSLFCTNTNIPLDLLRKDLYILIDIWKEILENFHNKNSNLLYENQSFIYLPLTFDVDETIIEKNSIKFFKKYLPLFTNVKYSINIFQEIDDKIEDLFNPIVQLKSGGYIVISHTPACTTIDINLGNTIDKPLDEAVLSTNMEAAHAIARHLLLRNISGIIIIDFIDMTTKNNKILEQEFKLILQKDPYKIAHTNITQFGIMEICRQYNRNNLLRSKYEECEFCEKGYVNKIKFQAEKMLREIEYVENIYCNYPKKANLQIYICNNLAEYLLNHQTRQLSILRQKYQFFVQDFQSKLQYKIIEL